MSAFGGKADMPFCGANVRLWPKADIGDRRIRSKRGQWLLHRDECLDRTSSRLLLRRHHLLATA